jgi:hypothetical protein
MDERLQQGARPNIAGPSYTCDASCEDPPDTEDPLDERAMSYRRADGTHRQRRVPDLV